MNISAIIMPILCFVTIACAAEAAPRDTIEIRTSFGRPFYFYRDMPVHSNTDLSSILVTSLNPKVMEYYSRYKRLRTIAYALGFGLAAGSVFVSDNLLFNDSTGVYSSHDKWLVFSAGVCVSFMIAAIPASAAVKYKKLAILEFNKS
jgi:hypothetical protein